MPSPTMLTGKLRNQKALLQWIHYPLFSEEGRMRKQQLPSYMEQKHFQEMVLMYMEDFL